MKLLYTLALTALCTCISLSVSAWGQTGHRTVGEIADRHLSDQARTAIEKILDGDKLSEISTWPDYIKSEDAWDFAKKWHYINVDPDETMDEVLGKGNASEGIDNVVEATALMEAILSGDEAATKRFEAMMEEHGAKPLNGSTMATALAFYIHMMGDLHQPLHAGMRHDKGGNDVDVIFFRDKRNLHSVWDSGIIDKEQLSFTEWADYIDDRSSEEMAEMVKGNVSSWVQESIKLRIAIYKQLPENRKDRDTELPSLYYDYLHDYLPVVQERLLAGGLRSAEVLNKIFAK